MKREHGMQPAEKDLGLVCHVSPPLRDNGIEEFQFQQSIRTQTGKDIFSLHHLKPQPGGK
jgi:hypothetical protein